MKAFAARLIELDKTVFFWIFGWRAKKRIDQWMSWISRSADGQVFVVFGFVLYLLQDPTGLQILKAGSAAFALELPSYALIKSAVKRIRPCDGLAGIRSQVVPPDRFSFPSGHTTAAFLMATLLVDFYPVAAVPLYGWAASVGLSRVHLGVHYPADVLTGAIVGAGSAWLGLYFVL